MFLDFIIISEETKLKMKILKISLICLLVWSFDTFEMNGQGEIQVDDIKVFKDFEAKLKDFTKVDLIPVLPSFDLNSRSYQYTISGRPIKLEYDKPSIRPLALPPIKEPFVKKGMVRFGYGLPNVFLADLSYGIKKGSMLSGFSLEHFSANHKNTPHQSFSTNKILLHMQNAFKNGLPYKAYADLNIDYYNLYAVDSYADTNKVFDDPKRRFTHWDLQFEIPSTPINQIFEGQAKVTYKFVHNNIESAYEHYLEVSGKPEWNSGNGFSLTFPLEASAGLSDIHAPVGMFKFAPALVYDKPFFTFELGGNMGFANDYFIYPTGKISLNKIFSYFDIFAGVNQHIQLNTAYYLVKENPFMRFASNEANAAISKNYFAGVRGNIEGALFEFVAAYHQLTSLPLFGISPFDERQFDVIYDNGTDFSLQAELDYRINENLSVNGRLANHYYNMDNQEKAWHKPAFETNIGAKTSFFDRKLSLEGAFFFKSGIFYLDTETATAENLPVIFDFNAHAQFNIFKNTYLFLTWNNITASKYNRWYQYPSYRTVLLGGFKVAF